MKDGPEGDMILSRLEQVEVALDDEGDPITSCVIEPVEGQPVKPAKGDKPESTASILRKAFSETYHRLADTGDPSPGLDGSPVRKVRIDDLRHELLRRGFLDADDKGMLTNNSRQSLFSAKTNLLNKGRFVEKDGFVWSIA
jgi:hypothetical protein